MYVILIQHLTYGHDYTYIPYTGIDNLEMRTSTMQRIMMLYYSHYTHSAITITLLMQFISYCYHTDYTILITIYITLFICLTKNFYSLL